MSKPGQMFTQSNREFHKAVKDGDLKTVLARLDKGHNIEQVDGMNNTPLKNAIYSKRHDIISALLDRGANFDEGNVYMVCAHGDIVALKLLVAHGADFDAVDRRSWAPRSASGRDGRTPLMGACGSNCLLYTSPSPRD